MDNNNNNYEQEFIKNIKQVSQPMPSPQPAPRTSSNASILSLVIAIVLAFIVLIESIVLAVFAVNYFTPEEEFEEITTTVDDSPEALSAASSYTYDENYGITAFNLTCTAEDGATYTFTKAKEYQQTDASSNPVSSGTYSIINSGAVVLDDPSTSGEDKIVYYDGYDIIDGVTFYTCVED